VEIYIPIIESDATMEIKANGKTILKKEIKCLTVEPTEEPFREKIEGFWRDCGRSLTKRESRKILQNKKNIILVQDYFTGYINFSPSTDSMLPEFPNT